ncbi:hypothetical protein [Chelativorans salis]|uniref:N-acetyltransferase domain-containing protein n=1 Tax=Chelativorans salis TaxID=2978478 RepID=A0ABT2LGM7_9HYPH|nr:hypothetical protein [Chelativorans sp. EGI FJ00035]MCT7373657.1 hypothetical protein [Chelativorans sp. EGI FJ00035]
MSTAPQQIETKGATCRIYRDAPAWDGLRTAAVGGFRCESAAAGAEVLARAEEELRAEGFKAILGPMDGDTWHSYRLVTESDNSPPFSLEPVSEPHDREAFKASGFAPVSSYISARASLDEAIGPAAPPVMDGVTVRPWDGEDAQGLLVHLFDMSAGSFAANPFFKPISREAFQALYEPVLPAINPRLVLFARDAEGLVGFLFGFPNLAEGRAPKTAIVKTYASRRRGVGHLLLDTFHRTARDLSFSEVIHALMHEKNVSRDRSQRHAAHVFRRYALMGKRL